MHFVGKDHFGVVFITRFGTCNIKKDGAIHIEPSLKKTLFNNTIEKNLTNLIVNILFIIILIFYVFRFIDYLISFAVNRQDLDVGTIL